MSVLLNSFRFGFNPSSWFASSETGLWVASSLNSSLKQNSDGTTAVTTTSDPVGYWADQSGNGNHLIQATAGSRPTYSSIMPSVVFDGTDDRLGLAAGLAATSGSVAILFKTGATAFSAGAQVLLSCADVGTANTWFEIGITTRGRIYLESNAAGTQHTISGSSLLAVSTAYTLVIVHNGTDIYAEVNGVEQNPLIVENIGTLAWFGNVAGADNTTLGGTITSAGLVRPFVGSICEVIATSKVITA